MAKKVFGGFLIVLITSIIFVYFKSGAYKSVEAQKTNMPALQLFYVENIGPYHKIVDNLNYVEDEFNKLGVKCTKTFAHFLSDPKIIEHEKLVSHVGCAFEPKDAPQLFSLPDRFEEKFFGESGDSTKICFKGAFKGSPSLSALKVYPALKKMAEDARVKLDENYLELYTIDGDSVLTETYLCED